MTWLSFCARNPGPEWKQGYGTGDRTLKEIEGVVDHSMEGSMAGAYSVLFGPAQSSWTFSIPKVGEPVQHYPLKSITWHCGLPGDRRTDTSLIGNLTLVGKEHEGVAGEPWTENQLFWSTKIDVALRVLCPRFGANPLTLRLNMWEHNWLSATSCPSGRNPWEEKFARINELEDDMSLSVADWEKLNERFNILERRQNEHGSALANGHKALEKRQNEHGTERDKAHAALLAKLEVLALSGGGLTLEEVIEAVKTATREGSG